MVDQLFPLIYHGSVKYLILLANYAAIGLMASKADVLVLANGTPETQLLNLTMLMAAAVRTCCRWVFASPMYLACLRPKRRTP